MHLSHRQTYRTKDNIKISHSKLSGGESMNLLHMKYAVEIAKTNSLNKAAETLYVGQSALSRAINELESSLGVTLFERSSKGNDPHSRRSTFYSLRKVGA